MRSLRGSCLNLSRADARFGLAANGCPITCRLRFKFTITKYPSDVNIQRRAALGAYTFKRLAQSISDGRLKMIIWQGAGFIVAVIAFAMLVLTELSIESLFADEKYYQTHGWPKLLALALAGFIVLLIGKYLNRRGGKVLIEKETGKEVVLKSRHSLFFINVEYWGYILIALGVIFLFVTTD
jgi:hypothetical protein